MTESVIDTATNSSPGAGVALFLRRWAANPLRAGSVIPSSAALCARIVRHGWPQDGGMVLELGAGTGVVSRAFLEAGLEPGRLIVNEVDPEMAQHLRQTLPGVTVLEGDARALTSLLPAACHGRIATVVCGIPLVLLGRDEQQRFISAMEEVAPGRGFLHFSYCATSPLPFRKHKLAAKREAWTPLNFPPASVWRYTPTDS